MNYKVVNKFLKMGPTIMTGVSINCETPYTFITRDIPGNRMNASEEELIKEVLKVLVTEINPADEIQALKEEFKKITEEINAVKKSVMNIKDLDQGSKDELLKSYPLYEIGKEYKLNDVLNYNGVLYKVVQAHTSQSDWIPDKTPALYTEYLNLTATVGGETVEIISDFVQPTGSHDAYKLGDKVTFNGKIYESLIDNNAYSPIDYPAGWKEITQ